MKFIAAAVLALAALAAGSIVTPQGDTFELLILHNNDMHARFEQTSQSSGACNAAEREAGKCYGGFPRVAHLVKKARREAQTGEGPPVLYLNAGDTYTGTAWFTVYKWKIAAEFINALHPDAVSLGNHEFDHGVGGLTPFIENLTCPVLSANLVLTKVPELAKEANLKKSVILDVTGTKVGIVGYLTPETKFVAKPNNVEYIDEVIALREEVKKLQDEGIKIIIAVGHSGIQKDLQIAKEVEGLDLVIGGHTNTFLWNGTSPDAEKSDGAYPIYVTQASGRRVPVVQAYAYTKYLGQLDMVFDSNGELVKLQGAPILLDETIPQDPDVLQIINRYKSEIDKVTDEIIGHTTVILDKEACSRNECNLGNLITDAMVFRYAIDYTGEHWTDAPIAIMPSGGIRTSIAHTVMPINITRGELLEVMPFDGNLVTVTMNGSILLQALEHAATKHDTVEPPGSLLQLSGIKVVYNRNKPYGSRVMEAHARCWACDIPTFSKIQAKEMYKVLMPSFIALGGDGYSMFANLPTKSLNYNELSSTQLYISRHSPIYPQVEGRIIFKDDIQDSNISSSSNIIVLSIVAVLISVSSLILA